MTFGSLGNFAKVNEGVLKLWARVLHKVSGSRLLVWSPEGSHRKQTLETLRKTYPCRCGAPNCRGTLAEMPKEERGAKKTVVARKKTPAKKKSSPAKREAGRVGTKKSASRRKSASR